MSISFLDLVLAPADGDRSDNGQCRIVRGQEVTRADIGVTSTGDSHDRSLVDRVQMGDSGAFETLVTHYYAKLVGFTESLVRDRGVAEDVVQDALLMIWQQRNALTVRTTVAGYLFGMVRHGALNHRRHLRVQERWMGHIAPPSAIAPPDEALEIDERERILGLAVDALDPLYRQILILRASGLTYEAIAGVLGIPVKTAKTRGLRGIGKLRAVLDGYW